MAVDQNRTLGTVVIIVIFLVACGFLTGCASPSKARYRQLLGECREANREHLRLVKAYDAEQENCVEIKRGESMRMKIGALWDAPSVRVCPAAPHPEQASGVVEMGLGGY